MTRVLVERRFEEPADMSELQAREDSFSWCLEQHRVKFIRSYFSKDRKTMLCEYEAPDAESVRQAQRTAGMPFERVFAARVYEWSKR